MPTFPSGGQCRRREGADAREQRKQKAPRAGPKQQQAAGKLAGTRWLNVKINLAGWGAPRCRERMFSRAFYLGLRSPGAAERENNCAPGGRPTVETALSCCTAVVRRRKHIDAGARPRPLVLAAAAAEEEAEIRTRAAGRHRERRTGEQDLGRERTAAAGTDCARTRRPPEGGELRPRFRECWGPNY